MSWQEQLAFDEMIMMSARLTRWVSLFYSVSSWKQQSVAKH